MFLSNWHVGSDDVDGAGVEVVVGGVEVVVGGIVEVLGH
jgi:hypothetical protein